MTVTITNELASVSFVKEGAGWNVILDSGIASDEVISDGGFANLISRAKGNGMSVTCEL